MDAFKASVPLPSGISDPFPAENRLPEVTSKRRQIEDFLAEHALDALLLSRHENIAWATAGIVEIRVASVREVGPASLLFTRGGGSYYFTTNSEAPRLAAEEFNHLDYRPLIQPWHSVDLHAAIRSVVPQGNVSADDPSTGLPIAPVKSLRLQLAEDEIARYRWLGTAVADAATESLFALQPGMTEASMQALIAERLLSRRILPSVLLTAVDDRILRYRHPVPRDGVLNCLGMMNFCARRWGLTISITRYASFGAMPAELETAFAAVAHVNAALLNATREGATAAELFATAQKAYADHGYPEEEQMHHQGGATGYWEREWIARPAGTESILNRQAVAWNPSIRGAKVEDTVVLIDGGLESLTPTPRLPEVETRCNGLVWRSAGVLRV
jgi:Xaa-Pro dipeptidase